MNVTIDDMVGISMLQFLPEVASQYGVVVVQSNIGHLVVKMIDDGIIYEYNIYKRKEDELLGRRHIDYETRYFIANLARNIINGGDATISNQFTQRKDKDKVTLFDKMIEFFDGMGKGQRVGSHNKCIAYGLDGECLDIPYDTITTEPMRIGRAREQDYNIIDENLHLPLEAFNTDRFAQIHTIDNVRNRSARSAPPSSQAQMRAAVMSDMPGVYDLPVTYNTSDALGDYFR